MKKSLRSILIVLLAVTCTVFTALGLTACNNVKLESLRIENAETQFKMGDEFTFGEDFAVYAVYSDGTEKEVTGEIDHRFEAGFDMNVPGNYQITVIWGGKREIYTIYVNEFDNILKKIELNTEKVKKEYDLGDEVSFAGLEITCIYENAQGNTVTTKTTSLRNFTVEIKGEDGTIVDNYFNGLGDFTITVSIGNIKASYKVSVSGVNISTVQSAIAVGKAFGKNILSGREIVKDTLPYAANPSEHTSYDYSYEFGLNYTYLKESTTNTESHYSMVNSDIFCATLVNGVMTPPYNSQTAMMDGAPFAFWYHREVVYGVENALSLLYKYAQECTNKDLKETADEGKREYTFSFSGLVFMSNASDYYETSVKFTLGDDYAVDHVEYEQKYWEYSVLGAPFVTDANGHTTPLRTYNQLERVTVEQVSGERYKTNPYTSDKMKITSYDLSLNGQILGDNPVVNCAVTPEGVTNDGITLEIVNMQPASASFMHDPLYFNSEGSLGGEVNSSTILVATGFTAYRNGNQIKIFGKNGGVWKLMMRTSRTYKEVIINVTGLAPSSMTSQVYNSELGRFQDANKKASAVGGAIYFRGNVNQYANDGQTAEVTSSNSTYATVEKTEINGVSCFKFSATQTGTYSVKVTSSESSQVSCNFTFTISEKPDYSQILSGTYTADDNLGNRYTIAFTPSAEDGNSGTVVVTVVPLGNDGEPLTEQARTQTLTYSVSLDNLTIVLTAVSGDSLGVDLIVNGQGQLELEDNYGDKDTLTRTN